MDYNIRIIEKKDNKALERLIKNVFIEFDAEKEGTVFSDPTTKDLFALFQKEKSIYWVIKQGEEIIGGCGVYPTDNLPDGHAELVKFYFKPKARGKGLSKTMMFKCENFATKNGFQYLYIESLPKFNAAVKIYEKNGYKILDNPLGNSGHVMCNIWMLKK